MAYAKLGVTSSHRQAMFRNMMTSLFREGRIKTTASRAREIKSVAEKMITVAKRNDLHARRHVLKSIQDKDVVNKLFDEIAPKYSETPGGYTRIMKMGYRRGDAAEMVILELV